MFNPFWPNAGPTGGAGLAEPAGICNFIYPKINAYGKIRTPKKRCKQSINVANSFHLILAFRFEENKQKKKTNFFSKCQIYDLSIWKVLLSTQVAGIVKNESVQKNYILKGCIETL